MRQLSTIKTRARKTFAVCILSLVFGVSVHSTVYSSNTVVVSLGVVSLLQMSLDSTTLNLGSIAPGTPRVGMTTVTVTTNSEHGYQVNAHRSSPGYLYTMRHSSGLAYLEDKSVYDGTAGSTALWEGIGFGFTVFEATDKNTAHWGIGSAANDTNNRYAGFPATSRTVHSVGYNVISDVIKIGYKTDIASSQRAGTYTGDVTYTAVVIP